MNALEANFDGLVGPTHNYAGLSIGNVASKQNAQAISNPKQAALQGLAKMKALHDLGFLQGVIAPHARPDIYSLRRLGFSGTKEQVLKSAFVHAPQILTACSSASNMWTANAATVSPSADTSNHKVHFTPANLTNKYHRSIEAPVTGNILRAMFNNEAHFEHHLPLPENDHFGDEGAANHTRFCSAYHASGVEFFVFGKYAFDETKKQPRVFPARQTFEASQAIARLHQLKDDKVVYAQQNPDTIDSGVFHNDVIAVGNKNVLFYHEKALINTEQVKRQILNAYGDNDFYFIEVKDSEITVQDAIKSYLFNTQLVNINDKQMIIVAPMECKENTLIKDYLDRLINDNNPISDVKYFDVKQSMQNGGGPACLRLRVVLNEVEQKAMNQNVILSDLLYKQLCDWVNKHYRDRISADDLVDPALLIANYTALDELSQLLNLGSVYPFQQDPSL